MNHCTRVLVADDHGVVAEALCVLFNAQPDIEVVATASTGFEAQRLARELSPDVVLMDVSMPELNGIEATRRIREMLPDCRVVMLSIHADSAHVQEALQAGASGYVLKRSAARDALAAIRAVRAGGRYLAPALAADLAGRLGTHGDMDPLERLSAREREVLRMLAESSTVADIGERLALSPKTVETYRARLMEKLDIHDLPGLVRFALRKGLITLD
jgi:DNA-binding NarL/FixJ family response regulator